MILFSFGEIGILNGDSLYVDPLQNRPRPPQLQLKINTIVAKRLAESNRQIAKACEVRNIVDKSYHGIQKTGEPDWNEVKHDAEREFGRKMLGEEG